MPVQSSQNAGSIAASAAQTGSNRYVLLKGNVNAGFYPQGLKKKGGGLVGKIGIIEWKARMRGFDANVLGIKLEVNGVIKANAAHQ